MIKNLFLVAGASFVLAVACFAGAAALGGARLFSHHWGWPHGRDWSVQVNDGNGGGNATVITYGHDVDESGGGPQASRQLAWNGGDSFDLDVPADVTFTQAVGPGKVVVTGPKYLVDHVILQGSHLQYDQDQFWGGRLNVVMSAPAVSHFAISGDGALAINGYSQDSLDVDVSGHGDISAKGKARHTRLDISGDGDVDLGGLPSDSAEADISGSGRATIAPASAADLHISGSGEIDLLTHPGSVNSDVSGSGRIVEGQPGRQS